MSGSQLLLLGGAQVVSDPNFEYTTLLLPGNGTNGAQNNTFLDSSTNNFTITRNGNTTQGTFSPFSQTGWGNYFDGTGDWISAPSNAVFDFSGDFTIELWFYATTVSPAYQGFCGRRANAASFGPFSMGLNGASVLFSLSTSGSSWALNSTGGTVTANSWNHVAFVRSGTACTAYLNGTSIITGTVSGALASSSQNLAIGTFANDGTDAFNGYISNFRVVKGTAVYTANFTPSTTPLTAITNTSLLTCQSNRFVDNSSNAFAITRNGDVSVQAFSPFNPTAAWIAATNGGSGYYDGSGDYLTVADNAALQMGSGNFTIEGWVYPTGSPGSINSMYGKRANSGSYGYVNIAYWNTGGIGLYVSSNTSTWDIFGDNGSIIAFRFNAWNHFALVRSGNNWAFFVNGARTHSTVNSSSLSPNSGVAMSLGAGAADGAQPIQGYLNGMRVVKGTAVYDPTLTTCTVPTAPLTAITNTSLLVNYTNAGIYDATSKNNLETVGNAQISTAQSKFGGSSMAFDGSGDRLFEPSNQNYNFGTGDFTIELWTYPISQGGHGSSNNDCLIDFRPGTNGVYGTLYIFNSGTGVYWFVNNANRITGGAISNGTWTHIAIARASGSTKLFINGTQSGSTYADTNNYLVSPIRIGEFNDGVGGGNFQGYINDLRITKGVARYTANFTPPTSAFPLL